MFLIRSISLGIVLLLAAHPARASEASQYVLQGKAHVCKSAAYMQLWDLAQDPLTRHRLEKDESCWKPMGGLRVVVVEWVGKFALIRYMSNGVGGYTYVSNLKKAPNADTASERAPDVVRTAGALKAVNSLTPQREVMLINGRPSVNLTITAGPDTEVELSIDKEILKTGFKATINRQKASGMTVSVRHRKQAHGLGSEDSLTFEVVERDDALKVLAVRLSGQWTNLLGNDDRRFNLRLEPATIRITAQQFMETVRPHTNKELARPFKDFHGRTT
jgi:hypothetical protein